MSGRSARPSLDTPAVADDQDGTPRYLLFAGSQRTPRGGLGDLVGAFASEATARQAFQHIRLGHTSATSWAQLAVVDENDGVRALSWFGIGATPARTPVTLARPERFIDTHPGRAVMWVAARESRSPAGREVEPARRRHASRRITVWLVGLVGVGVITIGVTFDDGSTRSIASKPATVDAGRPTNGPVVRSSVDGSAAAHRTSRVNG